MNDLFNKNPQHFFVNKVVIFSSENINLKSVIFKQFKKQFLHKPAKIFTNIYNCIKLAFAVKEFNRSQKQNINQISKSFLSNKCLFQSNPEKWQINIKSKILFIDKIDDQIYDKIMDFNPNQISIISDNFINLDYSDVKFWRSWDKFKDMFSNSVKLQNVHWSLNYDIIAIIYKDFYKEQLKKHLKNQIEDITIIFLVPKILSMIEINIDHKINNIISSMPLKNIEYKTVSSYKDCKKINNKNLFIFPLFAWSNSQNIIELQEGLMIDNNKVNLCDNIVTSEQFRVYILNLINSL